MLAGSEGSPGRQVRPILPDWDLSLVVSVVPDPAKVLSIHSSPDLDLLPALKPNHVLRLDWCSGVPVSPMRAQTHELQLYPDSGEGSFRLS